jgi:hypothetical protein
MLLNGIDLDALVREDEGGDAGTNWPAAHLPI